MPTLEAIREPTVQDDLYPQLYLKHVEQVQVSLGRNVFGDSLNELLYTPMNSMIEKHIIDNINATLDAYCSHHVARPANLEGAINNVIPAVVDHVAHDETIDCFEVDGGHPRRFNVGKNAWVSSYDFDRSTGTINVSLNLADLRLVDSPDELEAVPLAYDPNYLLKIPKVLSLKRMRLKSNLCIHVKTRVDFSFLKGYSPAEQKALDTLREMISERDFRKYIKYGFVTVGASSGRIYQIPRSGSHIRVWEHGVVVEEICVRIDSVVPPTDNIIAFMLMIQANEEEFKKLGNIYNMAARAA